MELTLQQLAEARLQAEVDQQMAILARWDDGRPMKLTKRQKPLPIPSPVAPVAPVSCISGNGAGGGVGTVPEAGGY